jgi:hypothetical protein
MPPPRAFVAALIAGLVAAMLMAWQLTSSFRTQDEFGIIAVALAAFAAFTTLMFWAACWKGGSELWLGFAAIALAVIAVAFSGLPRWMDAVDSQSTNPFPAGYRDAQIVLEFLAPALTTDLIVWRMTVRNLRRARGADARMRWPWLAMLLTAAIVISPLGLDILHSAFFSSEQLSRNIWQPIAWIGIATLGALLLLEWYLRMRAGRR